MAIQGATTVSFPLYPVCLYSSMPFIIHIIHVPFSTETKIPRYLDDGNAEDWAHSLSCGFCKTNLSLGDRGVIQSPDYPQAYTANIDCLWLLETANLEDRIYLDCDSVELGNTLNPIF